MSKPTYRSSQYGDVETTPHDVYYIKYPAFNQAEPHMMFGELTQPTWVTYGSMSFPSQERAEHELDLMRKSSIKQKGTDEELKHWKVVPGKAYRLRTPYNPFPSSDETEEDED